VASHAKHPLADDVRHGLHLILVSAGWLGGDGMDDKTPRKLDDLYARPGRLQRLRDWLVFVVTEVEFYAAVVLGAAALWSLHWHKLALLALPPLVMWRIARLSKDDHDDLHLLAACYIVWVALGVMWLWLFTGAD
jgi:hypothetical protein